jgi:glutaredoxin 2
MLPVLTGEGVPAPAGMQGLPESLEICSFLVGRHGLVAPALCRDDVTKWRASVKPSLKGLVQVRTPRMPVFDWAHPMDVAYAKWKYAVKGDFDYEAAEANTPKYIADVNAHLQELVSLIRGKTALNTWGWGMDDVCLLPDLRALTMVQGLTWPPEVQAYLDSAMKQTQMTDYAASKL